MIRVKFATDTLGCISIAAALFAPFAVWVFGYADAADSTSRSAGFIRTVQSIEIASIPVAAWAIGGYCLYTAFINSSRWVDQTAVALTPTQLILHNTYWKSPITLDTLVNVTKSFRGSGKVRTINPSLIIEWRDKDSHRSRSRRINNVDLQSSEGEAFQQQLAALGKWTDET